MGKGLDLSAEPPRVKHTLFSHRVTNSPSQFIVISNLAFVFR